MKDRYVLKLRCPDTTGIVAAVTNFLATQNATLNDAAHFSDEETGAVDDLLSEVAGFYEREVDHDLKYLADAIQPVLLCFIAALVLILMMGIVLPVWDLASAIR